MAILFKFAFTGRIKPYTEAALSAQAVAVKEIIERKTKRFHKTTQRRIARVLPSKGGRLDKDMDFRVFPRRGGSIDANGIVYSKTSIAVNKGRRGRGFDIIGYFNEVTPTVVRPNRSGGYLWIPTEFAKSVAGTASNNPRLFGPRKFSGQLQVILARNKKTGVAILKRSRNRNGRGTVMFVLIKQARIRQRLNLDKSFVTATKNFFPQVNRSFDKHLPRFLRRIR